MNPADRGKKHVCAECATKYYDLNRPVVCCPKCGNKPQRAPVRRGGRRVAAPPAAAARKQA